MAKRDAEKQFSQEYIILLMPQFERKRHGAKSKFSRKFEIIGAALNERKDVAGILAFSPKLPKDDWDIQNSAQTPS
jgi:hypothetical protein